MSRASFGARLNRRPAAAGWNAKLAEKCAAAWRFDVLRLGLPTQLRSGAVKTNLK